jgi:hypothetical protein
MPPDHPTKRRPFCWLAVHLASTQPVQVASRQIAPAMASAEEREPLHNCAISPWTLLCTTQPHLATTWIGHRPGMARTLPVLVSYATMARTAVDTGWHEYAVLWGMATQGTSESKVTHCQCSSSSSCMSGTTSTKYMGWRKSDIPFKSWRRCTTL